MEIRRSIFPILFAISIVLFTGDVSGRKPHVIKFRSPDLSPGPLAWDPKSQHFIVGSLRHQKLVFVTDAGISETLISDPSLPENSSIVAVAADPFNHRVLAVIQPLNAIAAYDAISRRRVFLTPLPDGGAACGVAADNSGNAYVTDSKLDLVWKINSDGEASVFSTSKHFRSGLNAVVFHPKEFLLVLQSNTGRIFKINTDNGGAKAVILKKNLPADAAEGIAVRSDGSAVVLSRRKIYFVKSNDNWMEGAVIDENTLEEDRVPYSITVGNDERVYVLYEGKMVNSEGDEFELVETEKESEEDDNILIYVLVAFGFAYFLFWRFQMRHLVETLNKKTA